MAFESFNLWRPRRPVGVMTLALIVALAWCATPATATAAERTDEAQRTDDLPTGRHTQSRGGPPARALAACQNASAGQKCEFTDQGRSLAGSCWAPADKPLACRPANAPGPRAFDPAAPKR